MKKMSKTISIISSIILFLSMNIYAFAADSIVQMSDGGLFDPSFFSQANPDAVSEAGTDTDALYQYYLKTGQGLGMKPFEDSSLQSLTYQPGSVVVPASIKSHPEAKHTLVYTDSNIDIFYSSVGRETWKDGRTSLGIDLYFVNKTNGDINLFSDTTAVNGNKVDSILNSKIIAGASSEEVITLNYPDTDFPNMQSATFEIYYKTANGSDKFIPVSFNVVFYH